MISLRAKQAISEYVDAQPLYQFIVDYNMHECENKSSLFGLMEYPLKDAPATADPEIRRSHSPKRCANRLITKKRQAVWRKKPNVYLLCHHECQNPGDFFESITSVCLGLTQTSWFPLRACVPASVKRFFCARPLRARTHCARSVTASASFSSAD